MFNFANYLVANGVSEEIVFFLLVLPFVAFIVGFLRYIIGLKSFGMYESLIVAYSFYAISQDFWTGLKFGIPLVLMAWIVSEIMRRILRDAKLHYITKVTFKVSVASIFLLLALMFAAYFGQNGYFTVNPLAIILILTLVESVSLLRVKAGSVRTNLTSLETVIIAIISYAVISSLFIKEILLAIPYLIVFPIVANFFVGKWTGLRLSEYLRFRNITKDE